MPISFATPPRTTLLSTRARVYTRLGITGEDAKTDALLEAASAEYVADIGYEIVRAELIETFPGSGWPDQVLGWAPLLELVSVSYLSAAQALSEFAIVNAGASIVRAFADWWKGERLDWAVRYWAGWLTPADDFSSADVTFETTAGTVTLGDATWPLLRPGDRFTVGSGLNAGTLTVEARTSDAVLSVVETLVAEATTAGVAFSVSNLPADIEQAVIERVADLRSGSTTTAGGAVTREEVDGVVVSYSTSSTGTTRVSAYDQSLRRRARIPL